jgi:hypothetical protein
MSDHEIASQKIEIAAPASVVWSVLTQLESYDQWNPLNSRVESTLTLGDPVTLWVTDPGVMETVQVFVHRLVAFDPERHLAWEWQQEAPVEIRTRRDQYVTATGPATCTYYTTDRFFGPGAAALMELYGAGVKQSFDSLARALKRRAEGLYGASGN